MTCKWGEEKERTKTKQERKKERKTEGKGEMRKEKERGKEEDAARKITLFEAPVNRVGYIRQIKEGGRG